MTGMEKKQFLYAARKERDQMLTLGSFVLPKLTKLNQDGVAESQEKGLRIRGKTMWTDVLRLESLYNLNQLLV